MSIAIFDPDRPRTYIDTKTFVVAAFDVLENIASIDDLKHRFNSTPMVRTFNHQGAIAKIVRENGRLFKGMSPGDYFIVCCLDDGSTHRYTCDDDAKFVLGFSAAYSNSQLLDPFGEVLRGYRSEIFLDILKNDADEPDMEMDDCDLSGFIQAVSAKAVSL